MASKLRSSTGQKRALVAPSTPTKQKIKELTFKSWDKFKASISETLFEGRGFMRGKYLFRGHSDPNWQLTSTFDRMFASRSKSERLLISSEMMQIFKRSLESHEIAEEAKKDDGILLALGQHYGLPTRLLDWTESPYIAAFFAYNSRVLLGVTDSQVAIWVLDTEHPIWSPQYGVEIVDVPTYGNRRIRNQAGKFTLAKTPFASLEEYVQAHGDHGNPLQKILIPASESAQALSDLDAMGIHHGSVYPEIEGAAQYALFRRVLNHHASVDTPNTPRPA